MAWEYICDMFNVSILSVPWLINRAYYIPLFGMIVVMLVVEWLQRAKKHGLDLSKIEQVWVRTLIYYCLVFILIIASGKSSTFIYFQF